MPLGGLSFAKMLTTFGTVYTADPLSSHDMTKMVCLRRLAFDVLVNYKPLQLREPISLK